jgi:putative hydrolase of the HAD superfamily
MTAGARYAAVLFDWGDTLVAFPGLTTDPIGHDACLERFHADLDCSCPVSWPALREAYDTVCTAQLAFSAATFREHRMTDRLAATLRLAGCECPLGPEDAERHARQMRIQLVADSRAMDGAGEVLDVLVGSVAVGVVSNHPDGELVRDTLAAAGLLDGLDTVVVSGDLGWSKPDARPFRRALADLGVAPADALFVGDTLQTDVVGAQALGLETAWLAAAGAEPQSGVRPDHRLHALVDVLALCEADRVVV